MELRFNISVITPSFNSASYIEDAIKSVLLQDYDNFEHVVIDGGSTDGTLDILKKYPHLKWISRPDKGQSDAMNKGFRMSAGDIIVYLNADDYFLPGAFKAIVPYFEKGASFVVGKIRVENDEGRPWINDPRIKHEEMLRHWENNAFPLNPVGYFYLREVQEKIAFNEDNHFAMDLEFLLECSLHFNFTKIVEDQPLGVFRLGKDSKTWKLEQEKQRMWDVRNFEFLDKFLGKKSEDFVREFRQKQQEGYEFRISGKKRKRVKKIKEPSFREKLLDFLTAPDKVKIIVRFIRRNIERKK